MIAKRIRKGRRQARGPIHKLAARIDGLTAYLIDARDSELPGLARLRALSGYTLDLTDFGVEPGEKVSSYWSHNLPNGTIRDWSTQMLSAAALAVRSLDPVEHIVFSWREDEHPTDEQIEEAAAILLDVAGYGNCLAIGAAHTNTKNQHGHLAVVRVDPLTRKTSGDGWDIDRLHQAIAIVEERQGWATEPNALYVARDGEVFCRTTGVLVRDKAGYQVKRPRRAREAAPADLMLVIADIKKVVMRAASWADFHARLEELGIEYALKGSGASIIIGEEVHKASALDPDLSRPKLERRFGPFEVNRHRGSPDYVRYENDSRAELARIRGYEAETTARLNAYVAAALAAKANDPASCAAIRATEAAIRARLKAAFAEAKARFKDQQLTHQDWKQAGRPQASFDIALPALLFSDLGPGRATASAAGVPGFFAQQSSDRCDYLDGSGRLAFSDYGQVVIVYDKRPAAIDAALFLVAGPSGGRVRVSGSDSFVRLCLERASLLGIEAVTGEPAAAPAHRTNTSSAPGATRAPQPPAKVPIPSSVLPANPPLAASASPHTNVPNHKPVGAQPNETSSSSQKENDNVERSARARRQLAVAGKTVVRLREPYASGRTKGRLARGQPGLRNLPCIDVVYYGGRHTSLPLPDRRRLSLGPKFSDHHQMRWTRDKLGLSGAATERLTELVGAAPDEAQPPNHDIQLHARDAMVAGRAPEPPRQIDPTHHVPALHAARTRFRVTAFLRRLPSRGSRGRHL